MAQSGYPGPAAMAEASDMLIPYHPSNSDQSHLPSATDDYFCREWYAWDSQMETSPVAQDNSCDTIRYPQWDERQEHLTLGASGPTSNDVFTRWSFQTTSLPVCHQHSQPLSSTGFSQQAQGLASSTHPSAAMPLDWQRRSETQSHKKANTSSNWSKGIEIQSASSSPVLEQAQKKRRIGSHGQSTPTPATSTDDSVHLIDDAGDDVEYRAQPAIRSPVEKGKTSYRAKNRVAAKRCREKTKQYEIDLANRGEKVTLERMYLDACVMALKSEVLALKNQILQHSDCNCEIIQEYIARAASDVIISAAHTSRAH